MPQYEVNWSLGGTDIVDAENETQARAQVAEALPKVDCDWTEIEVKQ